ncbi:hypothetical protein BKA70DRAFT_1246142, partial [Coprinopsis sp. MPI-PUGE-AT-0042]
MPRHRPSSTAERRSVALNANAGLRRSAIVPCSALEEDLSTVCGVPIVNRQGRRASDSVPMCPAHREQYRQSYGLYTDAKNRAQKIIDGCWMIPSLEEIDMMTDISCIEERQKWVGCYIEALRDERKGRKVHSIRFFNHQMDDGHMERYENVKSEIKRAEILLSCLGERKLLIEQSHVRRAMANARFNRQGIPLPQQGEDEPTRYIAANPPRIPAKGPSQNAPPRTNLNATKEQSSGYRAGAYMPPRSNHPEQEAHGSPAVVLRKRTPLAAGVNVAAPAPSSNRVDTTKRDVPQPPIKGVAPPVPHARPVACHCSICNRSANAPTAFRDTVENPSSSHSPEDGKVPFADEPEAPGFF